MRAADDPNYGCKDATACAPCAVPHAKGACASGACAVGTCDPGRADCNASKTDGCETDLQGDKNHCSDCANDCVASNGPGWICKAGQCEVNQCCPDGTPACVTKYDCDGDKTNGCEADVASDPKNCKTCGTVCNLPHAQSTCSQEACIVTICDQSWANCDGTDANGSETNISTGDKGNCGACGSKCNETHGGATCNNGTCVLACFSDFGDCDNNPGTGCETNIKTNPLHCNACGNACNPANVLNPTCTNGACGYDICDPGFANCNSNGADGCEINALQGKNNCGACGTVCQSPSGGTVVCNNGSCSQNCSGLTSCSGVCVDTGNDVNNCGGCVTACNLPANSSAACTNGNCGFNCNGGYAKCGSTTQCFDIQNAPAHCGGACTNCAPPANGTPTCSSGTCGFSCNSGLTKCASACSNLQNDKNNCGSCGFVCNDPANGVND